VLLAITFAPGAALVASVTRPRSPARYAALAASPAVSLGLTGLAFSWSSALGRDWSVLTLLAIELVVVVGLVGLRAAIRRTPWMARVVGSSVEVPRIGVRRWLLTRGSDIAAVTVAVLTAVSVVRWMFAGLTFPPGWDAMNHAFMARRVLDLGSVLPSDVCVTGSTLPQESCGFYPLVPHIVWAQTALLSGGTLSEAMLSSLVLLVPVCLVLASFALTRVLGAGVWTACADAAAIGIVGPLLQSTYTGLITLLLGAALSPGVALLVYTGVHHDRARGLRTISGLAVGGLLLTHTYDAVLAGILGIGLLATRPLTRPRTTRLLRGSLAALVGAALVVGPHATTLLAAGDVRHPQRPAYAGQLADALVHWVLAPGRYVGTFLDNEPSQPTSPVIILVGSACGLGIVLGLALCWTRETRWLRPFAVLQVVVVAMTVLFDTTTGPVRDAASGLFYGQAYRVFEASAAAPAVLSVGGWVVLVQWCRRRLRGRRKVAAPARIRSLAPVLPLLPVAVVVTLTVAVLASPSSAAARSVLDRRSPHDVAAYQRAGRWLAARLGPDVVVAEDFHRDFVPWLDADYGVGLLKGLAPLVASSVPDWSNRGKLWHDITAARPSRSAPCLENPYGVAFVVVSDESMPNGDRHWTAAGLGASPYLTPAYTDGPVQVFAVHDCPPAPPAAGPWAQADPLARRSRARA
jgi:hypothetical protein